MSEEENKTRPKFRPIIPDVSGIDMNKLSKHKDEPDFVNYNAKGRDPMSRTFQITGLLWLSGFGGGGLVGAVEGFRGAANPSFKIRMNAVLNQFSKRGSKAGNALAVLACMHTAASYSIDELNLDRYTGDTTYTTPVLAGFLTGAFYKSTISPRAALLAGVIGAGVSTIYGVGGGYLYNNVFRRGGRY
jgi:hypothetical protein